MGTMNLTLETKPTAAGGWLAYCEWARVILRGSPVEVSSVPTTKTRSSTNQLTNSTALAATEKAPCLDLSCRGAGNFYDSAGAAARIRLAVDEELEDHFKQRGRASL